MKTAGHTPPVGLRPGPRRSKKRRMTMGPKDLVASPRTLFREQQKPSVSNGKKALGALVPQKDDIVTNRKSVYRYLTTIHWKNDQSGPENTPEEAQKVLDGPLLKHVVGNMTNQDFPALPIRVSSSAFTPRKIFITTPQQQHQKQKTLKPHRFALETDGIKAPGRDELKRSDDLLEPLPVIHDEEEWVAPKFNNLWMADEAPWISLTDEPIYVIFPYDDAQGADEETAAVQHGAQGADDNNNTAAVQHDAPGADDSDTAALPHDAQGADDETAAVQHDAQGADNNNNNNTAAVQHDAQGADDSDTTTAGFDEFHDAVQVPLSSVSSDEEGQDEEPYDFFPEAQPDWTWEDWLKHEAEERASKTKEELEDEEVEKAGRRLTHILPLQKLRRADTATMEKYNPEKQMSVQEYEDLQHDRKMAREAAADAGRGGPKKRYKCKSNMRNKHLFFPFLRFDGSRTFRCLLYRDNKVDDPKHKLALNVAHMSEEMFLFAMWKWWSTEKSRDLRKFRSWIGDIAKFERQDALVVIEPLFKSFKTWTKCGQITMEMKDDAAISTIRKLLYLEPRFAGIENQLHQQAEIADGRHAEQADVNADQARFNDSVQLEQQQNNDRFAEQDGRLASQQQQLTDHRAETAARSTYVDGVLGQLGQHILDDRREREEDRREREEDRREQREDRRVQQTTNALAERRLSRLEREREEDHHLIVENRTLINDIQAGNTRRDEEDARRDQENARRDQENARRDEEISELKTTIKLMKKSQSRLDQGDVTEPKTLSLDDDADDVSDEDSVSSMELLDQKPSAKSATNKKTKAAPKKFPAKAAPKPASSKKMAAVRLAGPSSPTNSAPKPKKPVPSTTKKTVRFTEESSTTKPARNPKKAPATPSATNEPPVLPRRSARKRKPRAL